MEAFKRTLNSIWNSLSSSSQTFCCPIPFANEMNSTLGNNAAGGQRDVDPNVLTGKPCNLTFCL